MVPKQIQLPQVGEDLEVRIIRMYSTLSRRTLVSYREQKFDGGSPGNTVSELLKEVRS